ncbi:MAG: DUF4861 family protein [Bryobacteraceae bacterium]|nr:DUF4861 family protein [Bryobacteraceae bacterium]MDW8377152.1 glycoside hydrolase family 2 TIM barrel-domain containing protein [Bryobacterales bacterium]
MGRLVALILVSRLWSWAEAWIVRLEEPTGIEKRVGEIVRVPLKNFSQLASRNPQQGTFWVVDAEGNQVPSQLTREHLLFPATVSGSQVAEYRVNCCRPAAHEPPTVIVRQMQSGRIEMRSPTLRIVVEASSGVIQEAYHLGAGPQRSLNLVEMTPTQPDPYDIHPSPSDKTVAASPVTGGNDGWRALEGIGAGPWELTSGTLEGSAKRGSYELRLSGNRLFWSAPGGFRFASVSALPYLPFDRCADGDERRWPTGPDPGEPPDAQVSARDWMSPPGGVITYYARRENYGALSFALLDDAASKRYRWRGACSHRMEVRGSGVVSLALIFHSWRGDETALVGRSEARKVRQPLLIQVKTLAQEPGNERAGKPAAEVLRQEPNPRLMAVSRAPEPFYPRRISLDGIWELAWGEKGSGPQSEWRAVKVPGSVHLQWLPVALVYRPEAAWVSQKEWWYRRRFHIPQHWQGSRIYLEFEATDYIAECFLNGRLLGRHEGYIDPYRYELTSQVRPGENYELAVRVWTPVHYYWKHRPYTIKGSYGGVDQKPDDITALGITRSVWLRAAAAAEITDLAVDTRLEGGEGIVELELASSNLPPGARWEATLVPDTFEGAGWQIEQPARGTQDRLEFRLRQPRLWWTWEHGRPDLYLLDVRLKDVSGAVLDAQRLRVGIRTVARRQDRFYLNGKPVFLRGTNIYANLFLSEFGRREYERDLALIRQMNVNAIRVHCHFENPEFYDLADEQGFLVWQDFLEAWYPHDTEFSRHAAKLYDRHIRLVRNHASVFAWAPSDEEDLENYRDLSKHLAARAALLDPQDRWVQRSTGRYGDAHLYFGWYGGSIWDYRKMTANLVTELGATALPARSSLEKFLPNKWPIPDHAQAWAFHRLQIREAEKAWGDLRKLSLDQAIEISQNYAARLFQLALERARRRKEEGAGGIFHFFAIDLWPSVTMAAIDFYRVPSKVHATVARSFAPVAVSLDFDRDEWKLQETVRVALWAINDLHQAISNTEIRWRLAETGGVIRHTFPPDSSRKISEVRWRAKAPGNYSLQVEVWSKGQKISDNIYDFVVR